MGLTFEGSQALKERNIELKELGAKIDRQDANGQCRIELADGSTVEVWLTTGTWKVGEEMKYHKHDWEGFKNYLVLRL